MNKQEKQIDIYRSEYILNLETELEELKRNVKRYFELNDKWSASHKNTNYVNMSGLDYKETIEHKKIEQKLKGENI